MPGAYWFWPPCSASTARAITVGRPVDVGEALAQVDRPRAHRQRRHLGEDRRRDPLQATGKHGVEASRPGRSRVRHDGRRERRTPTRSRPGPRHRRLLPTDRGVHAALRSGRQRVLRQVPLRGRPHPAGTGRPGDGPAAPRGHRPGRRARARRRPDRDHGEQPDRSAGGVRAQAGQGVRHLQAGRGSRRHRSPGHADRGRHHHRRRRTRRDEGAAATRVPSSRWWSARSTAAPRGRTRWPTSGSRCVRCSRRPSWTRSRR